MVRGKAAKKAKFLIPKARWVPGTFQPLVKSQYHTSVPTRDQNEIADYMAFHNITLNGLNNPAPWITLDEPTLDEPLLQCIKGLGVIAPVPFQAFTWPLLLNGSNLIVTGSVDDSLAYLVPAFPHVRSVQPPIPAKGPVALILPSKDLLAEKIYDTAKGIAESLHITSACNRPGSSTKVDSKLIVSTPKTIINLLGLRELSLKQVPDLVCVEVEGMLDMPQFNQILQQTPPNRQVAMLITSTEKPDLAVMHKIHSVAANQMPWGH